MKLRNVVDDVFRRMNRDDTENKYSNMSGGTSCNTGNFPSMNHQRIQVFLVKNVSGRAEPFC